jgi:methionyl-tRNA synthetase
MLLSLGEKLPGKILVHGYLTVDGFKISKSAGNAIDPVKLTEKYPVDSIRYFLFREIPYENDGDFSEKTLVERHNSELADKLGNLVSRVSTLAEKNGLKKCENKLIKKLKFKEIERKMDNYELDKALGLIFQFIDKCNEYVQKNKLWAVEKDEAGKKLYELVESIKEIARLLSPFIPETSVKITKQFAGKIKKSEILFRKIK